MRTSAVPRGPVVPSRMSKVIPRPSTVSSSSFTSNDSTEGSNIRVVVRCRGRNDREVRAKSRVVVDTSISKTDVAVRIGEDVSSTNIKTYSVDHVFGPEVDQVMVFEEVIAPIVDDLYSGMNCTVFAYGQTGTGKTYTMSGDDSTNLDTCAYEAGIIPRVLFKLFADVASRGYDYAVTCSFVELYNEELKDLLVDEDEAPKKLRLFDDSGSSFNGSKRPMTPSAGSGVTLNGLSEHNITSAISGLKVLQNGLRKRQVAATKMNDYSSRSHTIFCISLAIDTDGSGEFITRSKINLVDLAGSENIGKSGAENKRAREAGMINQSLLTLGRVINSLVDKSPHIPYRESKLTRLLQDSLGGRTKTCIIATISPASVNIEETLSTLEYASRAKNIKNKPQVNNAISKKALLSDYNNEMEKLRLDLSATRKKNGIFLDPDNFKEINADRESQKMLLNDQQRKLDTLDRQLKSAREQLDKTKQELLNKTRELQTASSELDQTISSLESTESSLRQTRRALNKETILRKAHANTEDELHSIGGALIKSLDETLKDVSILQDKLTNIRSTQSQVSTVVSDSSSKIIDQVHRLQSRFEDYHGRQREIADSLYQTISALVEDECTRLEDTSSFLKDSFVNIGILQDDLINTTSKSNAHSKQLSDQAAKIKENVISNIQKGFLEQVRKSMATFTASLSKELEGFNNEIQQPLSALVGEFESHAQMRQNHYSTQDEKLKNLKNAIESTLSPDTLTKYHDAGMRRLEQALEEEKKKAAAEKQDLLANISALFDKFTTESNNRLMSSMQSTTRTAVVNSVTSLQKQADIWGKDIDDIGQSASAFRDSTNLADQVMNKQLRTILSTLATSNQRVGLVSSQLQDESQSAMNSGLAAIGNQIKALDEFLQQAGGASDEHNLAVRKGVEELCQRVEHAFTYLDQHLTNLNNNVRSHTESDGNQWAQELTSSWRSVQEDCISGLRHILHQVGTLKDGIDNSRDMSDGNTPKRRKVEFARVLPNTKSLGEEQVESESIDTTSLQRQPLEDVTNEIESNSVLLPIEEAKGLPVLFEAGEKTRIPIKPPAMRLRPTTGRSTRRN
ncbi:Kip1p [Sugiyamaella lignohabitans]|uniref:Kinesin-like protein KIP1 n=1 Tax=Sugiyamaella lignohabitans TaxID=796027 RepID=A0A167DXN9_9ASCO|nr:Kip1p [Sugiyamaella lignohabitans]ANB13419.1 Kip1p [Sugiyamaella lignohabitans]